MLLHRLLTVTPKRLELQKELAGASVDEHCQHLQKNTNCTKIRGNHKSLWMHGQIFVYVNHTKVNSFFIEVKL